MALKRLYYYYYYYCFRWCRRYCRFYCRARAPFGKKRVHETRSYANRAPTTRSRTRFRPSLRAQQYYSRSVMRFFFPIPTTPVFFRFWLGSAGLRECFPTFFRSRYYVLYRLPRLESRGVRRIVISERSLTGIRGKTRIEFL